MNESTIAALVGAGVYLVIRLIDYMLPKNRHWRFIERFTYRDHQSTEQKGRTGDE